MGVASAGENLRLSGFGGLHLNIVVAGQTGTGRDQLTEDDVLLQAHQGVRAAVHGGLSEHASGFLEGGGRQPRVGSQGGLGDTHQFGTA